ncbi:MAG TPA: hypothetical protein PLW65_25985 [Pseudomonadota bacterium]|nr:hypothetical protein [Pseudomonadota bacterium]
MATPHDRKGTSRAVRSRVAPALLLAIFGCVPASEEAVRQAYLTAQEVPPEDGVAPADGAPALLNAGLPPPPLFVPDIRWTDGSKTINHAYISPRRTSLDGRVYSEFEYDYTAFKDLQCFGLIRPEALTQPLAESTLDLRASVSCFSASLIHAATAPGHLGRQGALCDAAPDQPPGRVEGVANRQPRPCGPSNRNDCYTLSLLMPYFLDSDGSQELWGRAFEVEVESPKTATAHIIRISPLGTPQRWLPPAGEPSIGIEFSISGDGRVLVSHAGEGASYSVNPPGSGYAPCDPRGWGPPRSISYMHTDPNMKPYGVAAYPLRDHENNPLSPGSEVGGNYPWIDRNGANMFFGTSGSSLYYQNAAGEIRSRFKVVGKPTPDPGSLSPNPPKDEAEIRKIGDLGKRSGITAVGLWTHGKMVVLDSRNNNSDLAILDAEPPVHDRAIELYAGQPAGTRIGASNNFFINSTENVLNYLDSMRPLLPGDVVWHLSTTTGTDEVSFDSYLYENMVVYSPMNPSVNNVRPEVQRRGYLDGFDKTGTFRGEGYTLTPHVQNAATATAWNLPKFGSLLGGARVEPIAAGGVKGKGIWLDGVDDRIEYTLPAQPDASRLAASPWFYSLFINPTRLPTGTESQLVFEIADGSQVKLNEKGLLITKGTFAQQLDLPAALAFATSRYTHLGIQSEVSGSGSTLRVYIDGYLRATFTAAIPVLRLTAGTIRVGSRAAGMRGIQAWIDEFRILGNRVTAEEACNQALGTLVGVSKGPGYSLAASYPASSHAELSALLGGSGPTYARYVCESRLRPGADDTGYACRYQHRDARCVGHRIHFAEGPLVYGTPRPASGTNSFCRRCHVDSSPHPTLRVAAPLAAGTTAMERDRRRQPLQPPARLLGNIPAGLFGAAGPATPIIAPTTGLELDAYTFR